MGDGIAKYTVSEVRSRIPAELRGVGFSPRGASAPLPLLCLESESGAEAAARAKAHPPNTAAYFANTNT